MSFLDPGRLFAQLARDLPKPLHRHLCIVGSLAAAYHHRTVLRRHGVNTKDADVLVHPAGDIDSCREMAEQLLGLGWRRKEDCFARRSSRPATDLRAIRIHPPRSNGYYLELIGLPAADQGQEKKWTPVRLSDGWYGVPSFRCMRVISQGRLRAPQGLEYASPAMMALANMLAHREIGTQRMSDPIGGRNILRSAKDLGRVVALAWLAGREETASWQKPWTRALRAAFPGRWASMAGGFGSGLRALLDRTDALEEAKLTVDVGLLSGRGITVENLRATGERIWADLVLPVREVRS